MGSFIQMEGFGFRGSCNDPQQVRDHITSVLFFFVFLFFSGLGELAFVPCLCVQGILHSVFFLPFHYSCQLELVRSRFAVSCSYWEVGLYQRQDSHKAIFLDCWVNGWIGSALPFTRCWTSTQTSLLMGSQLELDPGLIWLAFYDAVWACEFYCQCFLKLSEHLFKTLIID